MAAPTDDGAISAVPAFVAHAIAAVAATVAAVITGSPSILAIATQSWADAGRRSFAHTATSRAKESTDLFGLSRSAYVRSMFVAVALYAAGAALALTRGVAALADPVDTSAFPVAYAALAVAALLAILSVRQAYVRLQIEGRRAHRDLLEQALSTSDPSPRSVLFDSVVTVVGPAMAVLGVLTHQLTGSAVPDALGALAVGALLAYVAVTHITRNRHLLLGDSASPALNKAGAAAITKLTEVDRVSFLKMEYVGRRQVFIVAGVGLVGDYRGARVAQTLRSLERRLEANPYVARAVLTVA